MKAFHLAAVMLGILTTPPASLAINNTEAGSAPPVRDPSFEYCERPAGWTTDLWTCNGSTGIIGQATGSNPDGNYKVDVGVLSTLVVFFSKDELPSLNENYCSFAIGQTEVKEMLLLNAENFITTDTDTEIKLNTLYCNVKLELNYYTIPKDFETIVTNLTNSSGSLAAPKYDGSLGYQPMLQQLWILDVGPEGSKINISLDKIDLGANSAYIQNYEQIESADGDFLLIGPGRDILGGRDIMVYGRRDKMQIAIPSNVAHVFFYSGNSVFNASGFELTYTSTKPDVTEAPPVNVTTERPQPPFYQQTSTFADVEGLPEEQAASSKGKFQAVMASMATDYAQRNNLSLASNNVTSKMVYVYNYAKCNQFVCNSKCASYNFSVDAVGHQGEWIFTADVLKDMLATTNIAEYNDDGWKVCSKEEFFSWSVVLESVLVVLFGVALALAIWRMSTANKRQDSHEEYEKQQQQKRNDMRRRSSGDISMIGIGGSVSSRGSRDSRRFTMPFPKPGRDDDFEADLDMAGYKEYDPDLGRVDPMEFGLQKEMLSDPHVMRNFTNYTNAAFVPDEGHEEETVFQRSLQEVDLLGTDSEDSDGGGAVSFSSFKKKPAKTFTYSAEVHGIQDSGETAL